MEIVKPTAVAINPADTKMLDCSAALGAIHGYDFAGTIIALASEVLATSHLEIGDRVAGMVHGMNKLRPDVGTFAQYVGACANLLLKIPDHMGFEEAASFGTGVATATMSLFSADIREYTRNELAYSLDFVSQVDTTQLRYAAMGRVGGRYVSFKPFRETVAQTRALTVQPSWVMILSIFGGKVALDGEYGRGAGIRS